MPCGLQVLIHHYCKLDLQLLHKKRGGCTRLRSTNVLWTYLPDLLGRRKKTQVEAISQLTANWPFCPANIARLLCVCQQWTNQPYFSSSSRTRQSFTQVTVEEDSSSRFQKGLSIPGQQLRIQILVRVGRDLRSDTPDARIPDTREIWRDGQAHICFSWSASFYATVGNKPNYWFSVSMLNICHSSTKGQLDRLPPSAPRQAGTWLSKEPKKAYWNIRLPVFPGQIPKSTTGCTSFCFPQMLMKGTWF